MTNLYLVFGVEGGLLAMILFIIVLVQAFRFLGQTLVDIRRVSSKATDLEFLLWGLGTALVGHVINFQAITYFDQTNVIWLLQLAAISSVFQAVGERHPRALQLRSRSFCRHKISVQGSS